MQEQVVNSGMYLRVAASGRFLPIAFLSGERPLPGGIAIVQALTLSVSSGLSYYT